VFFVNLGNATTSFSFGDSYYALKRPMQIPRQLTRMLYAYAEGTLVRLRLQLSASCGQMTLFCLGAMHTIFCFTYLSYLFTLQGLRLIE